MNRVICEGCTTVNICMTVGCTVGEEKPVVYYTGFPVFAKWGEHTVAYLQYVINHPVLGNCADVRTSSVQKDYDDGTIVTRNTVYKPIQEMMGS